MKRYLLATFGLMLSGLVSTAQTTLLSTTFNTGLSPWTTVDNSAGGTAGKWIRGTNQFNTADTQYYGPQTNGSPTAYNGFALILSNLNTNPLNTDLISPAINCSANTYIGLQFYQWFALANATAGAVVATVSVSTDNVNWSPVFDARNQSTGANPELVQIDISSYAHNQPTVYIKFNYQATNDAWWTIDDIKVWALPDQDVGTVSVNAADYIGINNFPVSATIKNNGGNILTSVTLDYDVNAANPVTHTFSGLNLAPFQTQTLVFPALAPLTTVARDSIGVTASMPNGLTDANPADNSANKVVTTLSHVPVKNVLIEEFSTVPCGYCPGGATRIGEIVAADGAYAVPVGIHAGFSTDAMTTADDNALSAAFTNAAPTANIDRILFLKQSQVAIGVSGMGTTANEWKDAVEARQPITPPVSISAYNTYNSGTRALSVTVNANFYGPVAGNFRINCYLIEDSVRGSGAGYDQHSYYHDAPATLNPWLNVGTTLIGTGTWAIAGYYHRHVDRKLLDGTWGTAGVVPANTTDGGVYSKTMTYTLPNSINTAHASLVAFVYKYDSHYATGNNEVMNVLALPLNSADSIAAPQAVVVSGIKETPGSDLANISLYPNPASDIVYLNYSLNNASKLSFEVYNTVGQQVASIAESNLNKGEHSTLINTSKFQSGLYFVTVKNQGQVLQTLKFVISK